MQINRNAYFAIFKASRYLSPIWFGGLLLLLWFLRGFGLVFFLLLFGDVGKRGVKDSKINVSQSSKSMS